MAIRPRLSCTIFRGGLGRSRRLAHSGTCSALQLGHAASVASSRSRRVWITVLELLPGLFFLAREAAPTTRYFHAMARTRDVRRRRTDCRAARSPLRGPRSCTRSHDAARLSGARRAFLVNPRSDQYSPGYAFREFAAQIARERPGIPAVESVHLGRNAVHRRDARRHFLSDVPAAHVMPTDVAMTWSFIDPPVPLRPVHVPVPARLAASASGQRCSAGSRT